MGTATTSLANKQATVAAEAQADAEKVVAAETAAREAAEDLRLAVDFSEERRQARERKEATRVRLAEEEDQAAEWKAEAAKLKETREDAEKARVAAAEKAEKADK